MTPDGERVFALRHRIEAIRLALERDAHRTDVREVLLAMLADAEDSLSAVEARAKALA